MDGAGRGGEDPPMGRPLVGFLAVQNCLQGGPLGSIGAFVDDRLHGAVSLEDGARP